MVCSWSALQLYTDIQRERFKIMKGFSFVKAKLWAFVLWDKDVQFTALHGTKTLPEKRKKLTVLMCRKKKSSSGTITLPTRKVESFFVFFTRSVTWHELSSCKYISLKLLHGPSIITYFNSSFFLDLLRARPTFTFSSSYLKLASDQSVQRTRKPM